MMRIVLKGFVGIGIWIMIIAQFAGRSIENQGLISLLLLFWSLGTVFGFLYHIRAIVRILDPSLKISAISFLSFRSGFLGIFPLDSVYMRLSQNSQPNSDTPDMNSRKER